MKQLQYDNIVIRNILYNNQFHDVNTHNKIILIEYMLIIYVTFFLIVISLEHRVSIPHYYK